MQTDYNCSADPVTPQNTQARNALLQHQPPTRNGVPFGPPGLSSSIFYGLTSSPPDIITGSNNNNSEVFDSIRNQPSIKPQADFILKEKAAILAEEQKVFNAFCNSFDATAQQFTTGMLREFPNT